MNWDAIGAAAEMLAGIGGACKYSWVELISFRQLTWRYPDQEPLTSAMCNKTERRSRDSCGHVSEVS